MTLNKERISEAILSRLRIVDDRFVHRHYETDFYLAFGIGEGDANLGDYFVALEGKANLRNYFVAFFFADRNRTFTRFSINLNYTKEIIKESRFDVAYKEIVKRCEHDIE